MTINLVSLRLYSQNIMTLISYFYDFILRILTLFSKYDDFFILRGTKTTS